MAKYVMRDYVCKTVHTHTGVNSFTKSCSHTNPRPSDQHVDVSLSSSPETRSPMVEEAAPGTIAAAASDISVETPQSPFPLTTAETLLRIAVEEIYAQGLFEACHSGVSNAELAQLEEDGGCSAYGDTDADLVLHCATELLGRSLNADDVFFDLGSGDGRLVLYLALLTKARRSVGVELCPTRHAQALAAKAEASRRGILASRGDVDLICDSMLEHDLAGATLVFSYNLPPPGGVFLYAMKAHLLRVLRHGACVLLRGQCLPAKEEGPRAFLADRTSWAVRLSARDRSTYCAHFRRFVPAMQTNVVNRMFQCVGYRLIEEEATLELLPENDGGGGGNASTDADERPSPMALDEHTRACLDGNRRLVWAVHDWIDAACARDEKEHFDSGGCIRELGLRERRLRLGDSPFERSVYECERDDDDDDMPPVSMELLGLVSPPGV